MDSEKFDLIVIGCGPAGARAAETAGQLGKRVAIVEREIEPGGAGINTGTIPSKTLRETALALSGLRSRRLYGVDLSLRREASIADFMYHERVVTDLERQKWRRMIARFDVTLYTGIGKFVDPHTVTVERPDGGKPHVLVADTIVIATGSSPARPEQFDFEDKRIHDSNEILELEHLPRKLIVVGSGVIGSEYASTFAAIGTEVHVLDGRDSLMPFLDREIATALETAMGENGITFHWKTRVARCDIPRFGDVKVVLDSGEEMTADGVLVAAGRRSNTEGLNLEAAGLKAGERGLLTVNEKYQTAVPHIYAVGDVIGMPALASTGMDQARVAMSAAYNIPVKAPFSSAMPTGIYTIPEVGSLGKTEDELKAKGTPYLLGRARYVDTARGKIIGDPKGFMKLLFDKESKKLIGAHIIGEQATELVHLGLILMQTGGTADVLQEACFTYPSLGELYRQAAVDALSSRA